MRPTQTERIQRMTVTAMLCALAYMITFVFHFKVMFLTFDLKDAVLTMTALLFGPLYGAVSSALVALLEFVTVSETGPYGLIMNFLSSAAFAVTAGWIYKYKRRFSGAILAISAAAVVMIAVMLAANLLITPFYMEATVAEVAAMIPMLLSFNACKAVMNAAVLLLLYKPLITALRRVGVVQQTQTAGGAQIKSILVSVVAILLIVVTCVIVTVVLGGSAQWF